MDVDEDDEEFMEGHEDNEEGNNNEEEEGDDNNMEDNEEHESILEWAGQILLSVYAKAKQLNPDFNIDKEDPETICFRVYKIDPDNNYYHKVENLGDQIFFVAEDGSSLSLLASDFKELQGNCIYFATTGSNIETSCISCEVGIFYLDSGKIEQPFPIVKMPRYSHLSWFTPSLW
ncbi:putative F-box protein At4g22180 [Rosa rugosa]|uniref:putative F-box protein At4g22180 n=1 Tax=Rosa rugosa TaxID=74645 RepID=UPI002B40798F|nr:putative F-box protein At4g22180 [Rosa rugosa]